MSLWLSLLGCRDTPSTSGGLSIASPEYLVLAQKALTYQTDFDTLAWADLLAEGVEYQLADRVSGWRGKAAVLAGWIGWQQRAGIARMRLSGLTHLPVQTLQPLPLMDKAGVYVISYGTAHVRYTDGHTAQLTFNLCYHFDTRKRIDFGWLMIPNMAIGAAYNRAALPAFLAGNRSPDCLYPPLSKSIDQKSHSLAIVLGAVQRLLTSQSA